MNLLLMFSEGLIHLVLEAQLFFRFGTSMELVTRMQAIIFRDLAFSIFWMFGKKTVLSNVNAFCCCLEFKLLLSSSVHT
jgi:hypothetical protein